MSADAPPSERFSLTDGGPTYRVMCRLRLGRSVFFRAVAIAMVTWLPLLILSALRGVALGDRVRLPFLLDIAAYARFLIAAPLLVLAECIVAPRIRSTVSQFTAANLIREDERREFEAAVGAMVRRRDSGVAEAVLLVLALIGSLTFGRSSPAPITTWNDSVWWYSLVSVPIFQFLLYRWLWRFEIWSAFLRRVSQLDLRVVASHPDLRGGLGFLALGQMAFCPIVFATFIALAGRVAVSAIYAGVILPSYQIGALALVIAIVLLFIVPLLFFTPRLIRVKITSVREYAILAARYTQGFERKWIRGEAPEGEQLLGSPDIQSLADLNNSYGVVRAMRTVPFGMPIVIAYLLSAIIPLLPLALLVMPAEDVGRALLKVLRSILG